MERRYDLKDRTKKFGLAIIYFCKLIPQDLISKPVISQLIRSGTSVGANYFEADNAESRKDYRHKVAIARKEAQETIYWLELVTEMFPSIKLKSEAVLKESIEINLILSSILKNFRI